MTVGVCASWGGVGITDPAANMFNVVYNATTTQTFTVTVVPSTDPSFVWKVSQSSGTAVENVPC